MSQKKRKRLNLVFAPKLTICICFLAISFETDDDDDDRSKKINLYKKKENVAVNSKANGQFLTDVNSVANK